MPFTDRYLFVLIHLVLGLGLMERLVQSDNWWKMKKMQYNDSIWLTLSKIHTEWIEFFYDK